MEITPHTVTTPMFICDAFADEHFSGNQAAVCFVSSDVYLMEWSTMDSLEASLGRGEPEKEEISEEERQQRAEKYRKERHIKCGAAFQRIAEEMNMSETAFVYRLPGNHVKALQEQIKKKVTEFEGEYKERVNEEAAEERRRSTVFGEAEPTNLSLNQDLLSPPARPARRSSDALGSPFSPGLIPSSSFSDTRLGESFLATRSCSITSTNALGGPRRPRRLHAQWFGIRWFTPRQEIALCGHATFAAAHALFESARLSHFPQSRVLVENIPMEFFIPVQTDVVCFAYEGGVISVRRREDTDSAFQRCRDSPNACEEYEVHFPQSEGKSIADIFPQEVTAAAVAALGLPYGPEGVLDVATSDKGYYVFQLADPRYVSQCRPDFEVLMKAFESEAFKKVKAANPERMPDVVALIVTAENDGTVMGAGSEADIISRFFAPWVGVPEDPVTGTAHTVIVPYWLRKRQAGELMIGDKLRCYQASRRGGYLTCIIIGRKAERIALIGTAVTFLRGSNVINVES